MRLGHKNILKRFESSIVTAVPPRRSLLLALSGGVDSMVLAHLTRELAPKFHWHIEVVHINHQLRGQESERDQAFVRNFCKTHGLICHFHRAVINDKHNLQERAREARFAVMQRLLKQRKLDHLLLAHHADDQVELFFLRLIQGTGLNGLAGMELCRDGWLVRPLLDFSKAELLSYAKARKLAFVEDSSNRTKRYLRNRIRHQLIPVLRKSAPQVSTHIIALMQQCRSDESAWQWLAAKALKRATVAQGPGTLTLDLTKFPSAVEALGSRLLQLAVQSLPPGSSISRDKVMALLELAKKRDGSNQLNLRRSLYVYRDYDQLTLSVRPRPQVPTMLYSLSRQQLPVKLELSEINREVVISQEKCFNNEGIAHFRSNPRPRTLVIDAERLKEPLSLRSWQPGDRMRLPWSGARRKLQDYFVDHKIPRSVRAQMVILTSQNRPVALLSPHKVTGGFVDGDYIVSKNSVTVLKVALKEI